MFKFIIKAPKIIFDKNKFNATLRKKLREHLREAAREFVWAAIVKVPVDTGQARGTFLPLGRALGITFDIGGQGTATKNENTGAENYPLLFRFSSNQYGEYFEVRDIQLFYYWFNDFFNNRNSDEPWKSIEEGSKAFLDYMTNVAPFKTIKLKDFIQFTSFDLGSNYNP